MTPATPLPDQEAVLVIARTAARRTAVAGLAAVGALVLAAPASALDVGGAVEQLAPGVTQQPDGTFRNQAGQLVDAAGNLIPVPLPPPPPLPPAVQQPVDQVKEAVLPAQPAPPPNGTPQEQPQQQQPQTDPQTGAPATQPQPAAAPPADAAPPAEGTVTATSIGGVGFAAAPGSIAALDRAAFSAGSGTAANPMSLFGAPQVAFPPSLEAAPSVAAPQVFTPAGTALPDLIPVGTPESVPGYLTALACAVVAGAAGAHVAALRARRAGAPAAA